MQHIINVAFDFDDKRITENIENQVEKTVIGNITEEVKNLIFEKRWGGSYDKNDPAPLRRMIEGQITSVLENHKEEIIENASKMLCEKLFRSKAVKDTVKENISQTALASCEC